MTPPVPTDTQPSWQQTFDEVEDGVVRLQVVGCEASWMGSGFLVGDDEVVTAAHVARGASSISAKGNRGVVRAEVVDLDLTSDTALLRLRHPLGGHHFTVTRTTPAQGLETMTLGYPFAVNDLRLTTGLIGSGETTVTYEGAQGFTVDHVVTTEAATNGGSSGGPVVDHLGRVVGLVSGGQQWTGDPLQPVPAQGNNFIVPARVIHPLIAAWRKQPPLTAEACDGDAPAPVDDEHELDVTIDVDEPESGDIAQALFLHGDSINQGRYDAAWAVLSPRMQQRLGDLSSWSGGLDTSWWSTMEITAVAPYAEGRALVQATLRTRQAPEFGRDGQTCSVWAINYQMQLMNGSWLIDDVAPSTPTVC